MRTSKRRSGIVGGVVGTLTVSGPRKMTFSVLARTTSRQQARARPAAEASRIVVCWLGIDEAAGSGCKIFGSLEELIGCLDYVCCDEV